MVLARQIFDLSLTTLASHVIELKIEAGRRTLLVSLCSCPAIPKDPGGEAVRVRYAALQHCVIVNSSSRSSSLSWLCTCCRMTEY